MASLAAIRDGLATRLATISGLEAFDTAPGQVNPPAAVVGGPERIEYDLTYGRGADTYLISVMVYASRADQSSGQELLDGYLAGAGATSIKAAIEADPTLGGAADTARVTMARNYGGYDLADIKYLGVELLVEVVG